MFNLSRPIESADSMGDCIKHVYSSFSYQWAIYKKYDRRGHEWPSGYEPLVCCYLVFDLMFEPYMTYNFDQRDGFGSTYAVDMYEYSIHKKFVISPFR